MARKAFAYIADQDGSATIWCLMWFTVFMIFAGLAIDSSNAYRVKANLQHAGDAAAHAAVIDLPSESQAISTALIFAADNMPVETHGIVVGMRDVTVGGWDPATRSFDPQGVVVDGEGTRVKNAVRVEAARRMEREGVESNPLGTQVLGYIGFRYWDIRTVSIAVAALPDCIRDGIIAMDTVDMTSNNALSGNICIHGQALENDKGPDGPGNQVVGIELNNGNSFTDGVLVSMPEMPGDLSTPDAAPDYASNPGLKESLVSNSFWMLERELCNQINIVLGFANLAPKHPGCAQTDFDDPAYRVRPDWLPVSAVGSPVRLTAAQFASLDLIKPKNQKTVYHVTCGGKGNDKLELEGFIEYVAIVTDCEIQGKKGGGSKTTGKGKDKKAADDTSEEETGPSLTLSNVLLMSTALGNGGDARKRRSAHTIQFPQGAVIGTAECGEADGGVRVYAYGSVKAPAQVTYDGLQIVTEGSVELAAQQTATEGGLSGGLNVLAGDDFTITANSRIGTCAEGNGSAAFTTRRYSIAY